MECARRRSGESGAGGPRSELKETKRKVRQQDPATIFTNDIEIKQKGKKGININVIQ
jgi:hypothetical protein